MPDEVIIADDGSGSETRNAIYEHQRTFPIPLIHAYQEDLGFRVARVRNLGVSRSSGEYIIFTDGDLILHPDFVKSHLTHRQPHRVLLGSRVLIPKQSTEQILSSKALPGIGFFDVKISHSLNMIHSDLLSRFFY